MGALRPNGDRERRRDFGTQPPSLCLFGRPGFRRHKERGIPSSGERSGHLSRALRPRGELQSGTGVAATANVKATVTVVPDAVSAEGIQRVTYEQGGTSGHETVEVVGGVGYLNGDSFTLENSTV